MDWKEFLKPTKGLITLFLVLFLLSYFFILPFFSSCKAGSIACRVDEPESICEQRNIEFKRKCDMFINSLTGIFLIPSYLLSGLLVNIFGRTRIEKFISYHYYTLLVLTILLTALTFLYAYEPMVLDAYILERGFPFPYWRYSIGTFIIPEAPPPVGHSQFLYPNLLLDIIIWYLISCLIVWIYDKYKKKK